MTSPGRRGPLDLADALTGLADRASVTVTGPEGSARPVRLRKARLGGFIPAKHEIATPWVRLVRVEDFLRGHCVGAELIGAHFPMSPDEDAALVALGWHHPTPADGKDYLRFWPDDVPQGPYLPREEAERAAAMVASFREVLAPDATACPHRPRLTGRPASRPTLPPGARTFTFAPQPFGAKVKVPGSGGKLDSGADAGPPPG